MSTRRAFSVDLLLNYVAFAVAAVGGLLFLFICAAWLGIAGLGVVSQVMALFVISGQLAAGGVQLSALQVSADPTIDDDERGARIWAALLTAFGWGSCFSVFAWMTSGIVASLTGSPEVGSGWELAAPALALFAVNKAAASTLIGLNKLRRFAAQLGLRALLLACCALLLAGIGADAVGVCWAFLATELLLCAFLLVQVSTAAGLPHWPTIRIRHVIDHLSFGLRGMWSGLAYEINVRLDVLMVGVFLSDAAVGLYGMVAQLAEGFFNLLVVLRNQLNPLVARAIAEDDIHFIREVARHLLRVVVPLAATIATVGTFLYAPLVSWFLPGEGYEQGTVLLGTLLTGLVINSWIMPLESVLVVSKNPGLYSWVMLAVVATNTAMNMLLIPVLGLQGAALATCLTTVLSGFYLLAAVRQRLCFWMVPFSFRRDPARAIQH